MKNAYMKARNVSKETAKKNVWKQKYNYTTNIAIMAAFRTVTTTQSVTMLSCRLGLRLFLKWCVPSQLFQ
jgi:hypothetical protein